MSLFALSESATQSVYRYLEQRTLNLVTPDVFLILTDRASLRRAVCKKSLISLICFGYVGVKTIARVVVVSRFSSSSVARVVTLSPHPSSSPRPSPPSRATRRAPPRPIPSIARLQNAFHRSIPFAPVLTRPTARRPRLAVDRSIHGKPYRRIPRARARRLAPRLPVSTANAPHARVHTSPSHRIVTSSSTHHGQITDRRQETARASRRLSFPRLSFPRLASPRPSSHHLVVVPSPRRPVLTHQSPPHHHTIPRDDIHPHPHTHPTPFPMKRTRHTALDGI